MVGGRVAHKIVGVEVLFMVARFRAAPITEKGCEAFHTAIPKPHCAWTFEFVCWVSLSFGIGFAACFAWLLYGSLI